MNNIVDMLGTGYTLSVCKVAICLWANSRGGVWNVINSPNLPSKFIESIQKR